jgi:hypothetical protein
MDPIASNKESIMFLVVARRRNQDFLEEQQVDQHGIDLPPLAWILIYRQQKKEYCNAQNGVDHLPFP